MKLKDKVNIFGDNELKRLFYLSAMVARQFNPIIKDYGDAMVLRGKPKKVALVAICRKLLKAIIYEMKRYKRGETK